MLIDWNSFLPNVKGSVKALAEASPDTVAAYRQICYVDPKSGRLDAKTRELISLAVAVTTRCDGCITVHSDLALKAGATKDEIAEALGVAMAMNAGSALIYSLRTMDAVNAKMSQASANEK